MKRTKKSIPITGDVFLLKKQLLLWGEKYDTVVYLDSNQHSNSKKDCVLAIEKLDFIKTGHRHSFEKLKHFVDSTKDYIFGFLGYDLKNDIEKLSSNKSDGTEFPDMFFFQPKKVIKIRKNEIVFRYPLDIKNEIQSDWKAILETPSMQSRTQSKTQTIEMKNRIDKETYYAQLEKILEKIQKGKVYEVNYCQEFFSKNSIVDPLKVFLDLNEISPSPFANFSKFENLFLLSSSPERFLRKKGSKILSQPIKGTAKRGIDLKSDEKNISNLKNDPKEIAENTMIVDLVRNDFSKIAKKRTVKVTEFCKIYTFKQIHQMISSISCKVSKKIHPVEIIKSCFPMGSMTGAPKISAMKIIDELEFNKRGIYSGSIGYFSPKKNFDFNVVIRSIVYNQTSGYLSFCVGSAITANSKPEKEYQECLIKAKPMMEVLKKQ